MDELKLHDSWKIDKLVSPYHEPSFNKGLECGAKTMQERLYGRALEIYKSYNETTSPRDFWRHCKVCAFDELMNGKLEMRE